MAVGGDMIKFVIVFWRDLTLEFGLVLNYVVNV